MYDKKVLSILENWVDNYIDNMYKKYNNNIIIQNKINHIKRTAQIASEIDYDNDLLRVSMKFHDIGRFTQYDLIKSFDDKILSHYILGIKMIETEVEKETLEYSKELEMIKNVIQYHMGIKYILPDIQLDDETLKLIDLASIIDGIDNGCYGVLLYLERECLSDAKNYRKNSPDLNMKDVTPEVLVKYLNGESFDKLKYCKTYADYVLFAASLAIKSLKSEYGFIAKKIFNKKCNKYENALEGYKDLFFKFVDSSLASQCYECLYSYYNKSR